MTKALSLTVFAELSNVTDGRTDRQADRQTVDCEDADSIRYGGAMGAAADSFISRKLLMDIYIGHRWLKKLKRV